LTWLRETTFATCLRATNPGQRNKPADLREQGLIGFLQVVHFDSK
jgi:hypothetical protein